MAMSQSVPSARGSKNLICGVCNEIYRHPKLLSCLHTFCLGCLENVARDHGPQSLPCPICHRTVEIPPTGVLDFANNPYITEQELRHKRLWSTNAICSIHTDKMLKFFCTASECEKPICSSCKMTEHFHHTIKDLSVVAGGYKQKLLQELERLEMSVQGVTRMSEMAQNNQKAAEQKAEILKEQVYTQHRLIVSRAARLRDMVLDGLADVTRNIDQELTEMVHQAQEALDCLLGLKQRIQNALDGQVNDIEVVAVEKEMRKGKGSASELAKVCACQLHDTARPGLYSYTGNLGESLEKDVLLFLGSPVKLLVPNRETLDVITPFFRCGTDKTSQEVHSIYRTDDGKLHVAYGGQAPAFAEEKVVHLDPSGEKIKEFHERRKISFDKSYRMSTFAPIPADGCTEIQANSNGRFRIKTYLYHSRKTTIQEKILDAGNSNARAANFQINAASKPCGFDANANGTLFVVINEGEAREEMGQVFRHKKNRKATETRESKKSVVRTAQVRLYRKNLADPVATYQSPLQHFFPTAISFWNTGRKELLLIADWMNDCVHVVHVRNAEFHFIRFLHNAADGHLVRPTALDVDRHGDIWIGCETGWLLRCEPLIPDVPEDSENESDSMTTLHVEIPSRRSTVETNCGSLT